MREMYPTLHEPAHENELRYYANTWLYADIQ